MSSGVPPRCIYCGVRDGATSDHTPPRCFFDLLAEGTQRITVPCCETCRRAGEADDAFVRNLLVSSVEAESNGYGNGFLSEKRNRSFVKDRTMLPKIVETMKLARVELPDGSYLSVAPAFELNRPECDRFFKRMGRALLHEAMNTGFVDCSIDWNPHSDFGFKRAFLQRATVVREVSPEFAFAAHQGKQEGVWFFLMTFFGRDFIFRLVANGVPPNHVREALE